MAMNHNFSVRTATDPHKESITVAYQRIQLALEHFKALQQHASVAPLLAQSQESSLKSCDAGNVTFPPSTIVSPAQSPMNPFHEETPAMLVSHVQTQLQLALEMVVAAGTSIHSSTISPTRNVLSNNPDAFGSRIEDPSVMRPPSGRAGGSGLPPMHHNDRIHGMSDPFASSDILDLSLNPRKTAAQIATAKLRGVTFFSKPSFRNSATVSPTLTPSASFRQSQFLSGTGSTNEQDGSSTVDDETVVEWLQETYAPAMRHRRSVFTTSMAITPNDVAISAPPIVPSQKVSPAKDNIDAVDDEHEHSVDRRVSVTVTAPLDERNMNEEDVLLLVVSTTSEYTTAANASDVLPASDNSAVTTDAAAEGSSSVGPHHEASSLSLHPSSSPHRSITASSIVAGGGVKAAQEVRFQRAMERPIPATHANHITVATLLKRCKIPMMEDVDSAEFDIFDALRLHGAEHLLLYVAMNVLLRYTWVTSMCIDLPKLVEYIKVIRATYRDENPYHNHIHAADVLQTTHIFLSVNDMRENFTDVELAAVLIGAIVHDAGHVGINNAFLVKTMHPLAQIYNGQSVLESCHASAALYLLSIPRYNFFPEANSENNVKDILADFRSLVVDCLLATDMKHHVEHISTIQGILSDGVIRDVECTKVLRAVLHVADISNPMKPYDTYLAWAQRVQAEFWLQGDAERKRGLPISMMCDRLTTTSLGKAQHGFIKFVVRPFAMEMAPIMPSVWLERLEQNAERMIALAEEDEQRVLREVSELLGTQEWQDDESIGYQKRLADGTPTRLLDTLTLILHPPPPEPATSETVTAACTTPSMAVEQQVNSVVTPTAPPASSISAYHDLISPVRAPMPPSAAASKRHPASARVVSVGCSTSSPVPSADLVTSTPGMRNGNGAAAHDVSPTRRRLRDVVPTPKWMTLLSTKDE